MGVNISEKEVVENRIIDLISEGSRLIAFRPKENMPGVDLVVKKRAEYEVKQEEKGIKKLIKGFVFTKPKIEKAKEIFLQVYFKNDLPENLIPDNNLYLVFLVFNLIREEIGQIWLIPSLEFKNVQNPKIPKYAVEKKYFSNLLIHLVELK